MSHRMLQVNENLKRELSQLLIEKIDWTNAFVTIDQVLVSANLRLATVWIGVLNTPKPEKVIDLLNKRSFELYEPLSKRLKMKYAPRVEFKLNDRPEEINRIDSLLDEIKHEL